MEEKVNYTQQLRARAGALKRKILFPDAHDIRTIQAVKILSEEKICTPVLIGSKKKIFSLCAQENFPLPHTEIIDPVESDLKEIFAKKFFEKRKSKGCDLASASESVLNPLIFAGMHADAGYSDGVVAGSLSTTGDVIRAGIYTIGTSFGISVVSSYFLMVMPEKIFAYADCGVLPDPNAEQLVDIAYATAKNFLSVTGEEPRVAFLSFSTKGSADHPSLEKIRAATKIFEEKYPEIISDGELQADAAIVPAVALRKAPDSPLKGSANILIFPDLNSGNIAYKLTERLGGAQALGPIVQGLRKPYCDLSRGCSAEDIINVTAICCLMV